MRRLLNFTVNLKELKNLLLARTTYIPIKFEKINQQRAVSIIKSKQNLWRREKTSKVLFISKRLQHFSNY